MTSRPAAALAGVAVLLALVAAPAVSAAAAMPDSMPPTVGTPPAEGPAPDPFGGRSAATLAPATLPPTAEDRAAQAAAAAAVQRAAAAAVRARAVARAKAAEAGRAAAEAEAAQERATAAHEARDEAQHLITSAVRAAYRAGPLTDLGLLTESDSPDDVVQGGYVGDVVARGASDALAGASAEVRRAESATVDAQTMRTFAAAVAGQAITAARNADAAEALARDRARDLDREIARRLLATTGLLPSAEQTPALLGSASRLKDVAPFAPGSGPNSNDRMNEWLASDRTVVAGTPRAHALTQLRRFRWTMAEWPCLDRMWWHESGWSPYSVDHAQGGKDGVLDPGKTWGIPQAYPASKMGDASAGGGPDWVTNPATQVNWGLAYIARRYGSPCRAWASWKAIAATGRAGWY